mgnify:CR=1
METFGTGFEYSNKKSNFSRELRKVSEFFRNTKIFSTLRWLAMVALLGILTHFILSGWPGSLKSSEQVRSTAAKIIRLRLGDRQ